MSGVEKEDKSGKKWKAIKKNRKGLIAMNIGKQSGENGRKKWKEPDRAKKRNTEKKKEKRWSKTEKKEGRRNIKEKDRKKNCMEKRSTFGDSKVNYNLSSQTFCPLLSEFQILPHFTDNIRLLATGKYPFSLSFSLSVFLRPSLSSACLSFAFHIDINDILWNLGYISMSKLNIHSDKLFNNTIGFVLHA